MKPLITTSYLNIEEEDSEEPIGGGEDYVPVELSTLIVIRVDHRDLSTAYKSVDYLMKHGMRQQN